MLPHAIAFWMATAVACSPTAIKDSVKTAARPAHGQIGVSARVIETNKSFELHGGQHFPMQSVYKLPIAIAVLHRVESGTLKLDQVVHVEPEQLIPPAGHSPLRDKHPKGGDFALEDLLKRSIVDSDGSASDAVMHLLGGPREVRRYMKQAEIKQIHVEHTEMQLIDNNHFQYDDWAKPDGIVNLLVRLQAGKLLNETDTALLLGWMRETTTGADRIRAMLPKETEVADKTGTSGMNDGIAPATNDVGLVTLPTGQHLAIAIFLSDAKGDTKARNAAIAGVAREVWDCWTEEQK